MKRPLMLGVLTAVTALSLQANASIGAKGVREKLTEYSKEVRMAAFSGNKSASALNAQSAKEAREKIITGLELPADKASSLSMALSGDKMAQRLDNLATIVAARKLAVEVKKVNSLEGSALDEAAVASAKIIANSALVGARKSGMDKELNMNANEMKAVSEALSKLETLPEVILTKFDSKERDSYVEIANAYDKIVERGTLSAEEAFVRAIMTTKKVDKNKALEIAKKLKECV
ncbi:MAG: hypothetical protein ACLGGX_00290 [Bdellovibrionia bacterium]